MREEHSEVKSPLPGKSNGASVDGRDGKHVERLAKVNERMKSFDVRDDAGVAGGLSYSGFEPNLVSTSHELYLLQPTVRTSNERRYARIPVRNVKACIKRADGEFVIVDLLNVSRGGVCFSSFVDFQPGMTVLIATHYIEGGQNIFQLGKVARVQCRPVAALPGEYAIEFLLKNTKGSAREASARKDGAVQ